MELEKFVRASLVEIVTGVRGANGALKDSVKGANAFSLEPSGGDRKEASIEFDVAVQVATSKAGSGKVGGEFLKIVGVELGGQAGKAENSTSRIRFKVDVNQYLG